MVVKTGWLYVLLALSPGVGCSDAGDIEPDPIVLDETEDSDSVLIGDVKDKDPVPAEEADGDSPVVEEGEPVVEKEEPVAEEEVEEEEPTAHDMDDHVEDSTPEFDPIVVVRPFPAIENPPIIAGVDVVDEVVAKELVLGVVVNGEARAYPINMLTGPTREIINDTLGGRDIAATW